MWAPANDDGVTGVWHNRTLDMSRLATGQLTGVYLSGDQGSTGNWSVDFADIALISADGTVTTLYNGQPVAPSPAGGVGTSNVQQSFSSTAEPNTPGSTRYYGSDQVGTAQLEFSQDGWPLWKGEFAPFGQELDAGATANRYKFTGKERDQESGLDYFGARYYGSNMGRFMSPDNSDGDPVPFADLEDPQTLNLYAYGRNNPLTYYDLDGHEICKDGTVADACASAEVDDPLSFFSLATLTQISHTISNQLSVATEAARNFVVAPRDPGCMNMFMGAGALAGAAQGGTYGAGLGATSGAVVRFAGFGVGAIPGGIGGGIAGGTAGAAVGGGLAQSGAELLATSPVLVVMVTAAPNQVDQEAATD